MRGGSITAGVDAHPCGRNNSKPQSRSWLKQLRWLFSSSGVSSSVASAPDSALSSQPAGIHLLGFGFPRRCHHETIVVFFIVIWRHPYGPCWSGWFR